MTSIDDSEISPTTEDPSNTYDKSNSILKEIYDRAPDKSRLAYLKT